MISIVWPEIKNWFYGENELIQIEDVQDYYAELLDKEAGIDYFVKSEIGLRPLSARVQSDWYFNTATFREKRFTGTKTELQKLVERIDTAYLHPWLHIQAYVDSENNKLFKTFGFIIKDVLPYLIEEKYKEITWYINKAYDGNIFRVLKMDMLKRYKVPFKCIDYTKTIQ